MATIPFDKREGTIWFDGEFLDWQDAKVHVLTHGLHYASGVFEGVRAYDGKIFRLAEHTARLFKSAEILDMTLNYTQDDINEICKEILIKNNIKDGYIRPFAWRGSEMMQISAQNTTIHTMIAAWQWPSYFSPEAKMKGLRMGLSPWRRPAPDTAPTDSKAAGLYMICSLSKHHVERKGYDDALLLDYRGYVAEATGANIFFLMDDGCLHTPIADCFLDGITRKTVIQLAKDAGYKVIERHIQLEELHHAKEAFLTGTAVEVTPIQSIEDFTFTPGDCCQDMIRLYDEEVHK